MMISLPASSWPYKVLNAVLLILLAWALSALFWVIFSPSPRLPVASPASQATATVRDMGALERLFSRPHQGEGAEASTLSFKLKGVIASRDPREAAAIFAGADGKDVAFKVGQSLMPGATLIEVAAKHVIVDNNGRREKLELQEQPAADLGVNLTPPPNVITPEAVPASAPAVQGPMPGPMRMHPRPVSDEASIGVRRNDLLQTLQMNAATASQAGVEVNDQGVRVSGPQHQAFMRLLQLSPDDVLQAVNQQPLRQIQDVSQLYNAFSGSAPVKLTVLRNGSPTTLTYRIKP
ncbi:hypothetical protein KSF73_11910 [Burkholderiaceae bacterium DAT-1]|nr:hypothetical protein [Burkholderiaceae bacterium DAT-1]